jgi:hypothetical protein
MLHKQDPPIWLRANALANHALPAILDARNRFASSADITATIDRVREDVAKGVIDRHLPYDLSLVLTVDNHRKFDMFLANPNQHLADTAQFTKFAEHESNGLANAQIGIFLNTIALGPHITDAHGGVQFTALGFFIRGSLRTLTERG